MSVLHAFTEFGSGECIGVVLFALVLFFVIVKFLGWIMRAKTEAVVSPPPLTKDQELLTEIRDLLRKSP